MPSGRAERTAAAASERGMLGEFGYGRTGCDRHITMNGAHFCVWADYKIDFVSAISVRTGWKRTWRDKHTVCAVWYA